jgi:hypothetical protein
MSKFDEYLERIYNEKMEGSTPFARKSSTELETGKGQSGTVADTLNLEIYADGQKIKGTVNNEKFDGSLKEFAAKYPDVAKQVLSGETAQGIKEKYGKDDPVPDFKKDPQTKGKIIKTPDAS